MTNTLILVAVVVGTAATRADGGQVRLWPNASIATGDITLGDVAVVSAFDPITTERLTRLPLRPAPRNGAAETVTLEEVRLALDGIRLNMADVTLCGATKCEVTAPHANAPNAMRSHEADPQDNSRTGAYARPPSAAANGSQNEPAGAPRQITRSRFPASVRKVAATENAAARSKPTTADAASTANLATPADTLESALRRHIAREAASLGGRVEVRFGAAHRHALALRATDCTFEIHSRGSDRVGMVWYEVDVLRKGNATQSIPILAEVTLLMPVVVATGIVNVGQEILSRDVAMEERPFKRIEDVGLCDLSQAAGMECRRALHPGDMLRSRDVRGKPLVRRNQIVLVSSRAGSLTVQQTGRAARDGLLGDSVDVSMDGSRERLQAVVIGPGSVCIGSGPSLAANRKESTP